MEAVETRYEFTHSTVQTTDGIVLAVHEIGQGEPLMFATGIGVHCEGLHPFFAPLLKCFRIITWDYRCMGNSSCASPTPNVSMERQAQDGWEILDALEIETAPLVGWSMGVPVTLEMIRQRPESVPSLVSLFGSPGRPFEKGFTQAGGALLRKAFGFLRDYPGISQTALDLSEIMPNITFALLTGLSFVGNKAHRDAFLKQVHGVKETAKPPYFETLLRLADHSAWSFLPEIQCPAFVVAGKKDWLTPASTGTEMARLIPESECLILDDATHFGLIEYHELIGRKILDFID